MEGLVIREDQGQGPPQDQAVRRSFEAIQASNEAFVAHLKEGAREAAQVMLARAAETGPALQAALARVSELRNLRACMTGPEIRSALAKASETRPKLAMLAKASETRRDFGSCPWCGKKLNYTDCWCGYGG